MTKLPLTVHGRLYSKLRAALHSNLREHSTEELLIIRSKAREQWVHVESNYGAHSNMAARQVAISRACSLILLERGVK